MNPGTNFADEPIFVSPLAVRVPRPGLALTPTPLSVSRPDAPHSRPEVRKARPAATHEGASACALSAPAEKARPLLFAPCSKLAAWYPAPCCQFPGYSAAATRQRHQCGAQPSRKRQNSGHWRTGPATARLSTPGPPVSYHHRPTPLRRVKTAKRPAKLCLDNPPPRLAG